MSESHVGSGARAGMPLRGTGEEGRQPSKHTALKHLDWSKTAPVQNTVPALLAWRAQRHPDRDLLVQDARRITYGEAARESAKLAARLLAAGVSRGQRIGILLPNGPEFVVTWLAIARIGAVPVGISTLSSGSELLRIFRSAGFSLLITTDRFLSVDFIERIEAALDLAGAGPDVDCVSAPHLRSIWQWQGTASWAQQIEAQPISPQGLARVAAAEELVVPADQATIIYTSGSTAEPKGVILSHGALMQSARRWAASMSYAEGDRMLVNNPMFWVGGLTTSLFSAMQVGATLLGSSQASLGMLELIERERCTQVQLALAVSQRMVHEPSFPGRDLSSLRDSTDPELLPPERRPVGPSTFGYAMGMTETAGPHTLAMSESDPDRFGAMGLLAPGMEHRIVDPETRDVLVGGEVGELQVRGDTLMLGYIGRERSETFDPDGWFSTGDLCSIKEPYVYFHARRDAMIKTAGANVAPAEVEVALKSLAGIADAHVFGVADPERGEVVGALIVPDAGTVPDPQAVVIAMRDLVSPYKVPRRLLVVETLPLTGTNKVDRRAAIELLEAAPSVAVR